MPPPSAAASASDDRSNGRSPRDGRELLACFLLLKPSGNGVVEDGAPAYTAEATAAVKAVEERVTVVERQVEENARDIEGLRGAVVELGRRMEQGFEALERRFEAIDRRFEAIDRRFEAMERRFEVIDQRFEAIERRLDRLDQQMSRQFFWVVGIQITTVLAMTGAIAAIAAAALGR